jgi:hypothetical protein
MINLGDKKWGVKDSGLLAYKQVGSKFFNKDFDFTRSSDATYIDKNGVLQTQSLYNLLTYSQDFSQWTKIGTPTLTNNYGISPFGVQNSTRVQAVSGNRIYLSIIGNSSTYTYSIYVKGSGTLRIRENSGTYFLNISPTSEWVRYDYSFTASFTNIQIEFIATSDVEIYGAQIVEGTEPLDYQYTNGRVGIPRIDFSDGVGSLLLEGQRTNLVTYSANINAYLTSQVDVTITYEYDISPDGTLNSSRVEFADSTAFAYRAVTISSEHTASIYVKGTAGETIMFGFGANVTVGSIYTFTGEWQRLTFTATSGAVIFLSTYGGATARDFEAFGLQLEAGSYATSYIKSNSGSATTRTADLANNCGTEQDFNSEEGVLYAEISGFENDLSNRRISLSDGTANNSIRIFYYNDGGTVFFRKYVGGVQTSIVTINSINQHEITKIAIKYNSTNFDIFANGVKISTNLDSNSFPTNTLNKIGFADGSGSGTPFYGKARSVKYFPTALGDSKLITLTGGDGSLYGLFNSFEARVLADGGTIESQDCIINELKELL